MHVSNHSVDVPPQFNCSSPSWQSESQDKFDYEAFSEQVFENALFTPHSLDVVHSWLLRYMEKLEKNLTPREARAPVKKIVYMLRAIAEGMHGLQYELPRTQFRSDLDAKNF